MIKLILAIAIIVFYAIRLRRSVLKRSAKNRIQYPYLITELLILALVIFQLAGYDPLRFSVTAEVSWLGLILAIGGAVFSSVARITLKKNYVPIQAAGIPENIVTGGIYKIVRHPSYLGTLLAFIGLEIALGSFFIFLPIILFPYLIKQIDREEKMLSQHFGQQWRDYQKQTRFKLIPFIY